MHRVSDDYKLVSSKWKVKTSQIDLGDGVKIGQGHFQIMAGPCSIEGEKQIHETIQHLSKNNVSVVREGLFKPSSSPYSYSGLGIKFLKDLYSACQKAGIKIITEVMQTDQMESVYEYVDVFQVGAQNAQNFNLLDALGSADKPVMLKRDISGTINELFQATEYVFRMGMKRFYCATVEFALLKVVIAIPWI